MADTYLEVLERMLATADTQPDRKRDVVLTMTRIQGYPFERADELRNFHEGLKLAECAGAIRIEWEKYHEGTQLARLRLVSMPLLAKFLGAPLREKLIEASVAEIDAMALPRWLKDATDHLTAQWSKGKKAFKLGLDGAYKWPLVVRAAIALDAGLPNHEPMDYRQFGARFLGDSKLTKVLEGPIAALFLWHWKRSDLSTKDVMRQLNLERLEQAILLRGPIEVGDGQQSVSADIYPYIGVPPSMLRKIVSVQDVPYVLTIENLSSFIDHAHHIRDKGIVLYTAGYPTSSFQRFYQQLCNKVGGLVFHWGDTDVHGFQILVVLQGLVPATIVRPHLMNIESGSQYTDIELSRLAALGAVNSEFKRVIDSLVIRGTGKIEQETVNACSPVGQSGKLQCL